MTEDELAMKGGGMLKIWESMREIVEEFEISNEEIIEMLDVMKMTWKFIDLDMEQYDEIDHSSFLAQTWGRMKREEYWKKK